jgi:Zn-dependent M28 family amino/carboxypeptidase
VHPVRNVVATRGGPSGPAIILGAHFDTRQFADQDPTLANRKLPVPGANDGASGVAVLLEIARSLPADSKIPVRLVFFDTEDQGDLPGWDWILGSKVYAQSLTSTPLAVVVVDMIGDADLNIYQERSSNPALVKTIWQSAADLGYAQFIPQPKYSMIDDHTPFLEKGYPAVDLIDFDYPNWHTIGDTPDKVSAASLKAVGDVLIRWILVQEQLAK